MKARVLIARFCVTGIIVFPPAVLARPNGGNRIHAAELLSKGDPAGARLELEARLRKKPNDQKAKLLLGAALVRLSEQSVKAGDRSGAIALDREALALDPDEPYWHSALAKLLYVQGNTEEATKECSLAAQLFPLDSDLAEGCGFEGKPALAEDNSVQRVVSPGENPAAGPRVHMSPPVPMEKPEPPYSEKARSVGFQGTTVLWFVLNAQGEVEKAAVVQPLGLGLDEIALRTVRTWKFKPATKEGAPVPVKVKVEVSFRLF
jgi:TonB family protein